MNAHKFQVVTGTKQCSVCGMTRGAKAHKAVAAEGPSIEQVEADVAMEAEMDVEAAELGNQIDAEAIAEARKDMLPEVSDAVDDSEIADALAKLDAEQAEKADSWGIPPVPDFDAKQVAKSKAQVDKSVAAEAKSNTKKAPAAKKAPAKKVNSTPAKKAEEPTASIWVGWRITNAAVLEKTTVAAKLKAAKPTGDLDRTVKLTVDELKVLDAVAAKFQEPGHTGPEQYSGRALRGRIAKAIASIEAAAKAKA